MAGQNYKGNSASAYIFASKCCVREKKIIITQDIFFYLSTLSCVLQSRGISENDTVSRNMLIHTLQNRVNQLAQDLNNYQQRYNLRGQLWHNASLVWGEQSKIKHTQEIIYKASIY